MTGQTIQIENSIKEAFELVKSVITLVNGKIMIEDENSISWIYQFKNTKFDMFTNLSTNNEVTVIKTVAKHPDDNKAMEEKVLYKFNYDILDDVLAVPYKPVIQYDYEDFFANDITQETLTFKNNIEEIEPIIKNAIKNINGIILEEDENKLIWLCEYKEEYIKCLTILSQIGGLTKINTFSIDPERKEFNERVVINKLHIPVLNNQNIKVFNTLKADEASLKNIFCPHCGKELSLSQYQINNPVLSCSYCEKEFPNIFIQDEVEVENNSKLIDNRTTDPFAIITFACGLGGFILYPILFLPVGYISSMLSYYRLKENPNLKGGHLRVIGAILLSINVLWLLYEYKVFLKMFNTFL